MRESPKLFSAGRWAMPGDYAIIVTAAVSQQERLRRTQDNPDSAFACSCSPASSERCRRNRRIAPTPTVPGLAGGPNRCSPQPGRGPVSLRRPSNSNRSVGRYLFTRSFKRTASTVLRCRFAPAKRCPPLALRDETRPGGLLGGFGGYAIVAVATRQNRVSSEPGRNALK
jgi:hypothetical protein